MKLENKVAIITGAGSGIGQATAYLFAQEGAKIVVADIAQAAGEETATQIRQADGTAIFIQTDVSKEEDIQMMVQAAITTFGQLDILHNNAGITIPAPATETSEENWYLSLDVNLKSVILGCKHAIPEMIKNGGGSIINTASMLGLVASPNQAAYCAAKGGVVMLTKQIAIDYAKYNIRANCICPSEVDTPMHHKFIAESPDPDTTRQQLIARIPLGRVAHPKEIATTALFLASDDASYITGIALPVDGGLTAL